MWSLPEPTTYNCPSCGFESTMPGECTVCAMRTPYEKGLDAAKRGRNPLPPLPKLNLPPPIERQITYQDGYRDGLRAQGRGGPDGFTFSGF